MTTSFRRTGRTTMLLEKSVIALLNGKKDEHLIFACATENVAVYVRHLFLRKYAEHIVRRRGLLCFELEDGKVFEITPTQRMRYIDDKLQGAQGRLFFDHWDGKPESE